MTLGLGGTDVEEAPSVYERKITNASTTDWAGIASWTTAGTVIAVISWLIESRVANSAFINGDTFGTVWRAGSAYNYQIRVGRDNCFLI